MPSRILCLTLLIFAFAFTGVSRADTYPKAAQDGFMKACMGGDDKARAACHCILEALEANVAFEKLAAETYDAQAVDVWTVACYEKAGSSRTSAPSEPDAVEVVQPLPEKKEEGGVQATIHLNPSRRPGSFETLQKHFSGWVQPEALPAVSADGKYMAVAHVDEDGVRGHPNMTLRIFEVGTPAPIYEQVVLGVEEARNFNPKAAKKIEARVEKIRTELGRYSWRPMAQLELIDGQLEAPQLTSDGAPFSGPLFYPGDHGALTVSWVEPRLVAVGRGGKELFSGTFETPGPGPGCAEQGTCDCEYLPYLRGAYADLERGVLAVTLGFIATDMCVEPDSKVHVVKLPPAPRGL